MDNSEPYVDFLEEKYFVSMNKNCIRFCTNILLYGVTMSCKISIYLLALAHSHICKKVGFIVVYVKNYQVIA